jgi:tetratricopeptide (TPR) repeat protein
MLARLRSGHVLITSRIANWSAVVMPLELHTFAEGDAVAFLLERTSHRRQTDDDEIQARTIARELDGLALALEQTGAYINKLRLSFAEYLRRWQANRIEVLSWYDPRLMQHPMSVAVTWRTTFDQLAEPEQRLLDILGWLAPEPIPLRLFDSAPLMAAIPDPHGSLSNLADYSLVRYGAKSDTIVVHRLVQEIVRARRAEPERRNSLQVALSALDDAIADHDPRDVRTWLTWIPLAPHVAAVLRHAEEAAIPMLNLRLINDLGIHLQTRGQFPEAERLNRWALRIAEGCYGPDHPTVATYLNNLATVLLATNRWVEAEPLFRRSLAISERNYGPDHPKVATSLNSLGALLHETKRWGEAEPLFRRSLAILERSLGPEHPNVGMVLDNLAEVLQATGRKDQAESFFRRAVAIGERSLGLDHPAVATRLNNLAGVLRAMNQLDEAELHYRRVRSIDEQSLGPDHPAVARDLSNLGSLLQATNRLDEAEPLYRRAAVIDERIYGTDHPKVARHLHNLADLLNVANRVEEAEPLMRRVLEIMLRFANSASHEHPHFLTTIDNYVGLLLGKGQSPERIRVRLNEIGRPFGIALGEDWIVRLAACAVSDRGRRT